MPNSDTVAFPLELTYFVTDSRLTALESNHLVANAAIGQLRALGRLKTMISVSKFIESLAGCPLSCQLEMVKEVDEAFEALGYLEMMVAEAARDAVYKMDQALTRADPDQSES